MRSFIRLQDVLEQHKAEIDPRMDFWVENFGAQAAGWLVFKHRRQLHRYGSCDFTMPRLIDTPPWMRVALEALKRRGAWSVQRFELADKGLKVFRVNWHAWGHFKQGVERITRVEN